MRSLLVWDLPTRLYHWLQAGLVAAALWTGFFAPEWWLSIHVWLGYGLAALVIFRLVWGIFGSEHSRFASFIFAPRRVFQHLRGVVARRHQPAIGHNPLGGVMVLALIGVIAAILISGLVALGGEEKQGALAGFTSFSVGAAAMRIHALLAIALIAMVGLHLVGVAVESRLGRQSLVAAMITGRKSLPVGMAVSEPQSPRWRAATLSLVLAGGVTLLALGGASTVPSSGMIAMAPLESYQAECGACHEAYHPSLLPRASWSALMAGLGDHFGEDAGLDPQTARAIAAWLDQYASEAWDSEAANRLRRVDGAEPYRITASPFWRRKHARIAKATFVEPLVHGAGNCQACHRDAASGRFDDQMIALPQP